MKAAQDLIQIVDEKKGNQPSYKKLGEYTGVLVKVPSINDEHMKYITAHTFNGMKVASHYRRGDLISGRLCVTRNFYNITAEDRSSYAVADITIFRKTTENGNSILIDIYPSRLKDAGSVLKIGSFNKNGIKIPGTDRYVSVEARQ